MRFLSPKVHAIVGLVAGILLLLAPGALEFSDNPPASMISLLAGIVIIVSELVTTSPISPLKLVPMRVHSVIDYLTGIFLAISPWLFGFINGSTNAWLPHVAVGILVVLYALMTNPGADSGELIIG